MKNRIERQIKTGYGDLRKSEKQAADYILSNMDEAADLPLDRLASCAKVSQPTVLRMLRSLGFDGYKDFRYQLVAELARARTDQEEPDQIMCGYTPDRRDTLEKIPANMTAATQRMMEETLKNFSGKTYRRAVEKLKKARLIDIYSVENSEVTALDLLTKLLYLGLPCRHFSDYYFQRICAGNLTPDDVAVGVSYTGESKDTVDVMRTARKAGACTIVITNFKDSTIAKYADILICTGQEQFFCGDAVFSRTTQLLIVDMIYMGIIASDYERYVSRLNECEKTVREKAYDSRKRR